VLSRPARPDAQPVMSGKNNDLARAVSFKTCLGPVLADRLVREDDEFAVLAVLQNKVNPST